MASSRVVPADVLPTRQLSKEALVKLVDGHWQSSEGKLAEAHDPQDERFPAIGDVLPAVGKCSAYETEAHARKRTATAGQTTSQHVVLALDTDRLGV